MRLTYSVELSPRAWVPVALLEGRIAAALGENLEAVRDYVVARDGECPHAHLTLPSSITLASSRCTLCPSLALNRKVPRAETTLANSFV